ncbi:MAG: alpha-keto acid decarboxylase family protein [Nitrososphaeraceae archaeon]
MSELSQNVGGYIIQRLYDNGVRHIFGVPGDFVLGFYQELIESNKLKIINTCDEQGAAFAADAYARINGLGVVCVTYCVGGLKIVNATAQAFAEKSPLVVISGAPGIKERRKNPLLHHKVRDFDTQQKIFEHMTVDSVLIDNPATAAKDIDRVLSSAMRYKRPVYIELPRDKVLTPIPIYQEQYDDSSKYSKTIKIGGGEGGEKTDSDSMQEALAEAIEMINSSKQPIIIAGVEIHRFALQDKLLQLTAKTNIPVVATVLSKSVISEDHPLYLGVYEGAMGHESVREYVESSDCLILMGALMTDINFSISPTPIEPSRSIYVTSEKLSIKHHNFENILLQDFLTKMIEAPLTRKNVVLAGKQDDMNNKKMRRSGRSSNDDNHYHANSSSSNNNNSEMHFSAVKNQKITVKRLFEHLNFSITDNVIVIADVGDSLFGALDLTIHGQTDFLSPAYYCSMGFAVPAAIGAQLANPKLRPIVIVGDGAFQMTGMEISTISRFALNPIIIVLNNNGYGTERPMLDGPFNDVLPWNYYRIPEVIGGHGRGFMIETEDQLEESLLAAENIYSQELCILDVRLDTHDGSPALQRLTESLGKKVNQNIK